MPIYVFQCAAGHVKDRIVPYDTKNIECDFPGCKKTAYRNADVELPAKRNPEHGLQR